MSEQNTDHPENYSDPMGKRTLEDVVNRAVGNRVATGMIDASDPDEFLKGANETAGQYEAVHNRILNLKVPGK